jgi:hypothetical protein
VRFYAALSKSLIVFNYGLRNRRPINRAASICRPGNTAMVPHVMVELSLLFADMAAVHRGMTVWALSGTELHLKSEPKMKRFEREGSNHFH